MTLFRWILGFLLTVSLVIGAAVVLLPLWFNPNDFRDDIEAQVLNATGRQITLDGDLSLSVFPWLGVKTQELVVKQPAAIGGDFIRVDTAQLRLKFMPLLQRRVQLDTIVVESPTINMIKVSESLDSFTVNSSDSNLASEPNAPESETAQPQKQKISDVSIAGLRIANGILRYTDRTSDTAFTIEQFELELGNILSSQLAPLYSSGVLSLNEQPNTQFELRADGTYELNSQELLLKGASARVMQAAQSIDLEAAQLTSSKFSQLRFTDAIASVASPGLGGSLKLQLPELAIDLERQTLNAKSMNITLADTDLLMSDIKGRSILDQAVITAAVRVADHSLASTLKEIDIDYQPANSQALTSVGMSGLVSLSSDAISISEAKVALDETQIKLNATVRDFGNLAFTFDIEVDQLRLDDYLPQSESAPSSSGAKPLAEALILPLGVFDGVKANGSLAVGMLASSGVVLNDVVVDVESNANGVSVKPRAKMYDGTLGGDISFAQVNGTPQLKVKNTIDLVSLSEFLSAADVTNQLSGLGSLELDLTVTETNGVQRNEGTIKLLAKNGALKGVDVKRILDASYAQYKALRGKNSEEVADDQENATFTEPANTVQQGKSKSNDETQFAELIGTFNLKDFKITNRDFVLNAPLFRVTGAGDIDLEQELIDYRVGVTVVNSTSGQGGEAIDKLKGITVPVRFRGNLLAPSFSIDTQELYRTLVKRELNEEKGAYLQEKLGIEGAENMSTKETVKQILLEKLTRPKKTAEESGQERPMQPSDAEATQPPAENAPQASAPSIERPMQPREATPPADDLQNVQTPAVTPADNSKSTQESVDSLDKEAEKSPAQTKEELKRELGKQLLEELFQ